MNVYVFVKRVPDTESKIRINRETNRVSDDGLNFVLSPYDEYAVEEALRLREAQGGKVTVFSVGTEEARVVLKKCLAMGADEAVLIEDDHPETYDGLRTAKIIAAVLKGKYADFDLLLFGKQSVGADNGQVHTMVADILDLPQANVVTKLEITEDKGTAVREIEGASEKIIFSLPAVISAQKGLNEPRYETLKGIMMAKRKEIPILTLNDLGIKEEELSPMIKIVKLDNPPSRAAGTVIDIEPEAAAKKLVQYLHEEAKLI